MMVIVALITAMLLAIIVIILKDRKNHLTQNVIEVPLEDLAQAIWLRYNKDGPTMPENETKEFSSVIETDFSPEDVTEENSELQEPQPEPSSGASSVSNDIISNETKRIIAEIIEPNVEEFKNQNAYQLVMSLLELIEKEGNCPSIVNDREMVDLKTVKHVLSDVTLKEHVYNVAFEMMKILDETYENIQPHIPLALFLALGHDIGKIPSVHQGQYTTKEHPIIAERYISNLASSMPSPKWLQKALHVIRYHHSQEVPQDVDKQWWSFLKHADHKARALEMMSKGNYTIKSFDSYFDLSTYLGNLIKIVDSVQTDSLKAFIWNDYIFVDPQVVYDVAKDMVIKNGIVDELFLYETNKEQALEKIVGKLRTENLVSPDIPLNKYSKTVTLTTQLTAWKGKPIKRMYLILLLDKVVEYLKIDKSDLLKKSAGRLGIIEVVIPS
ncbi:HD domain-containing protein [Thermodesulfovibrio hydrogeniphilus]